MAFEAIGTYAYLTVSPTELSFIIGSLEFCLMGYLKAMYERCNKEQHTGILLHCPKKTQFTKWKFKDKIIKNFKTVNNSGALN